MLKAVLFDLDGTVLHTLPDLNACMNEALRQFGCPPVTMEQSRAFVGHGGKQYAVQALPPERKGEIDAFYALYKGIHVHWQNTRTKPFPQEGECLAALRAAGLKLAVVTNKSQGAADVLAGTLLKEYGFAAVIGNRDGVPVKPDPATTFEALRILGVSPAEAVFVGDGDTDVQTAKNAGMRCISVLWGYRSKEQLVAAGAETFAENFLQLRDLLLGGGHAESAEQPPKIH